VITKRRISEFIAKYPDSRTSLINWYTVVCAAEWRNSLHVREVFGSADQVGNRTVFNISGNKYRLIARLNFKGQRAFVLYILTHKEYDKGDWKD
jgi:mRNA interferase HigB